MIYYERFASDDERVLLDEVSDSAEAARLLLEFKENGTLKGSAVNIANRTALIDADLSEKDKIAIYRDRISDKRDDDIASVMKTGLSFNDFLEAQNQYTTIEEKYDNAGVRATMFSNWADKKGYSEKQKAAVTEAFKYFSQIPQEAERYEKFTSAGISEDAALKLDGLLRDASAALPEGETMSDLWRRPAQSWMR
jgi:hypothetical protein